MTTKMPSINSACGGPNNEALPILGLDMSNAVSLSFSDTAAQSNALSGVYILCATSDCVVSVGVNPIPSIAGDETLIVFKGAYFPVPIKDGDKVGVVSMETGQAGHLKIIPVEEK